jgi:hypothetical protein
LHSEGEAEPAVEKQQRQRHMPPPHNPLETMGKIDDASHRQRRSKAEGMTEETRSLLKMIREQVVSDVDAEMASTELELEAKHWQQKEAMAACHYTRGSAAHRRGCRPIPGWYSS